MRMSEAEDCSKYGLLVWSEPDMDCSRTVMLPGRHITASYTKRFLSFGIEGSQTIDQAQVLTWQYWPMPLNKTLLSRLSVEPAKLLNLSADTLLGNRWRRAAAHATKHEPGRAGNG